MAGPIPEKRYISWAIHHHDTLKFPAKKEHRRNLNSSATQSLWPDGRQDNPTVHDLEILNTIATPNDSITLLCPRVVRGCRLPPEPGGLEHGDNGSRYLSASTFTKLYLALN